jgi:hypothetical protein
MCVGGGVLQERNVANPIQQYCRAAVHDEPNLQLCTVRQALWQLPYRALRLWQYL